MKKLFLYAAVLLLTATACTTEDSNFPTVNAPTVTATIQQADSRVAVDAVKDATTSLKWESGDQILVVDADGKKATYESTSAGSSATFAKASGDDIAATGAHTAYSPAAKWNKGVSSYRFTFASTQGYCEETFDPSSMPMMATNAEGLDFTFTPLAAVLRLNIMAGSEGIKVNSIVLASASKKLCGDANVNEGKLSIFDGANDVTLDCDPISVGLGKDEPTPFYLVVPQFESPKGDLTITITTNEGEIVKTSVEDANFQAGKVYDINLSVDAPAATDYVDLGIVVDGKTVLWATTNVGADNPWEYGGSYAWGETKAYGEEDTSNAHNYAYGNTYTKTYYDFCTYKWATGTDWKSISKYSRADGQTQGWWYDNDGKYVGLALDGNKAHTQLEAEDDAATANWGNDWRMPTAAELDALKNNCYWQWVTTYSGKSVEGYMVYKAKDATHKGKRNDETINASYSGSDVHIFLPAAGYRGNGYLYFAGSYGNYWSSELSNDSDYARNLDFDSGYVNADVDSNCRYYGQSVRPVRTAE